MRLCNLNLPMNLENPSLEFEVGNEVVHNLNLPDNPENPLHEVEVGHEVVQFIKVPFFEKCQFNNFLPYFKKHKTLGLRKQMKTKEVATRKYQTRPTMGFKTKFKGNFSEPIELE
nr:uncharacterized protein LOC109148764 isoform X2 [Ipomoea batatas]